MISESCIGHDWLTVSKAELASEADICGACTALCSSLSLFCSVFCDIKCLGFCDTPGTFMRHVSIDQALPFALSIEPPVGQVLSRRLGRSRLIVRRPSSTNCIFTALHTQDLLLCCEPLDIYLYAIEVYAIVEEMYGAKFAALIAVLWCCVHYT